MTSRRHRNPPIKATRQYDLNDPTDARLFVADRVDIARRALLATEDQRFMAGEALAVLHRHGNHKELERGREILRDIDRALTRLSLLVDDLKG